MHSHLAGRDDAPPPDPDESLIDECCLLPSQLLVPCMDWLPVNDGVIVKLQGKQPIRLHFGKTAALASSDGLARYLHRLFANFDLDFCPTKRNPFQTRDLSPLSRKKTPSQRERSMVYFVLIFGC